MTDPLDEHARTIVRAVAEHLTQSEQDYLYQVAHETLRLCLREAREHRKQKHERNTNKAAIVEALTSELNSLLHERNALERELGSSSYKSNAPPGYNQWRVGVIKRLNRNEERYRELKQMRHKILKDSGWNSNTDGGI